MSNIVALDTETSGLFKDDGAELKVITVTSERGSWFFCLEDMTHDAIERLMDKISTKRLVCQNIKFDITMLTAHPQGRDFSDNVYWDTMLATRILMPQLGFTGLKAVSRALWGVDSTESERLMDEWLKENRKGKASMWMAPREILEPYAVDDTVLTWKLYKHQLALLEASNESGKLSRLIARELEVSNVLLRMEQRGIGWNVVAAQKAGDRLEREVERIKKKLPFRPTKPGAVKYFFGELDRVPMKLTPSGNPSMDDETRRMLMSQKVPHAVEFDRHEKLKQYRSMWYEGWTRLVGKDGRLRTSFRQMGTASWRFSVERVQLQAIPHDYQLVPPKGVLPKGVPLPRELIRAKEGFELWELDVSQAEIRIASVVAKCKRMLKIVESGGDIHDETCKDMFNYGPDDKEWKQYRSVAKRLNFAMVYGVGVRTLVAQVKQFTGLEITEQEAREYLNLHRTTYPEFPLAARAAEQRATGRGYVKLCSGNVRWFQPHEELHKAFNQVIQGGVAEAMKDAMLDIDRELPGTMLLAIHDSVVLELPVRKGKKQALHAQTLIRHAFERYYATSFKVDMKRWGE